MKYRMLGRTGLRVSEIGYGAGISAGLFINGTHEYQAQTLRRALELGINFFDTAPRYGATKSEINLGEAFAVVQPESIVLGTKVGLEPDEIDDVSGAIRGSLEGSLKRLGRNQVDIYYLHNPITKEGRVTGGPAGSQRLSMAVEDVIGFGGVADVMDDLKLEGLIKHGGFTASGDAEEVLKVVKSGRFDVMQGYHSLLNPSGVYRVSEGIKARNYLQYYKSAHELGMGIVNIRAMAAGALAGEVSRTGLAGPVGRALITGSSFEDDLELAKVFGSLVWGDVNSRPEAAIRFALSNQYVSTVLVGFSSIEQMEEACAAEAKGPLSQAHLDQARSIWEANFGEASMPA